jgi:hypothetical protein
MRHRRVSVPAVVAVVLFLMLPARALLAQGYIAVFPQFAIGGGWSNDLFIDNQGSASSVVDLSFYGDSGDLLTVDCTLGVGSSFSFTLNGGNTKVVRVSPGAELKTGYVVLSLPSGASVRASEVFRYSQNGVVLSSLGVAQQFALTSFSFPAEVDLARGVNTGVAIANGSFDTTGAAAQSCIVSLVRSDGTLQDTAIVSLGSGEHVSRYLNANSLFPGLDNFSGTVSVSAARPIGLVALRQDQSVFATVSIDAGPILAPFLLGSAAVAEVEPNSTRGQAQRISPPVVMSGNISIAGDVDYFQFTGKQGDVVTALVSTASLGSALDSVLYLLNSDGTTFTSNDENGLFFQSDSFLQAVLPSDGTYYLAVTDYSSRGGVNGTYRLHVQLMTPRAASASAARAH